VVVFLLRYLIPPHADNEEAANYLRTRFPLSDNSIQWSIVRPDALVNESEDSPYEVFESPISNVIFESKSTSRSNVAKFMYNLSVNNALWSEWVGKMPVVYNACIPKG
jgi:hypothetical protein